MPDAPSRRKYILRALALLSWLLMAGWLVRYEAFPEWFAGTTFGYRDILPDDVLMVDSWARVLHDGTPIGYTRTHVDVNEGDERLHYIVRNVMHLRLNLLGTMQRLHTDVTAHLDTYHRLQAFECRVESAAGDIRIEGKRRHGTGFTVRHSSAAGARTINLDIPEEAIIYSPMTEMAVRRLRPGQTMSLRTFDPISLSSVDVLMEALRREAVVVDGQPHPTTVIRSSVKGMEFLSWVDRSGKTLRQTTPFGWTMETCRPEEAVQSLKEAGSQPDLLARLAVPCRGVIRAPRDCRSLRIRVEGAELSAAQLASPRQQVLAATADHAELVCRRQDIRTPAGPDPEETVATDSPWRHPSLALQSDHPDIRRTAATITEGQPDERARAAAIAHWVDTQVANAITVSVPSALDVLQTRQGDCNEHTYLYVALARAAGLPARVRVGLVYQDGAFYYHAWPAVLAAGHWYDLDPTLSQNQGADATHVSLAEGELVDQLAVLRLLGRIRITVLEEEAGHD